MQILAKIYNLQRYVLYSIKVKCRKDKVVLYICLDKAEAEREAEEILSKCSQKLQELQRKTK